MNPDYETEKRLAAAWLRHWWRVAERELADDHHPYDVMVNFSARLEDWLEAFG